MAEQLTDVTIDLATEHDAADIARVHVSSWREGYAGILPDTYLASLDVAEREQRWLENLRNGQRDQVLTWIARGDGQVVGFSSLGPARDEDADRRAQEIYSIYLAPDAWGHGVARDLMRTMLEEVAPQAPVTLWVLSDNERARHFYRRHGFSADGTERMVEVGAQPYLEVRYRRG